MRPPFVLRTLIPWVLCIAMPAAALGQNPLGAIRGVVRDAAGGVVGGARVRTVDLATGQVRVVVTGVLGQFDVALLLPGAYDLGVEADGFRRVTRAVTVEAGTTTTADLVVEVGAVSDTVTVGAASGRLRTESPSVGSVITPSQVEALPLNGRSYLELAKLEPGVQPPGVANRNRTTVSILDAPAANIAGARFTVDGGSVTGIGLAGSQMGFSQELVQEFQVTTVNPGVAAGLTDTGSINVVTRAGSNAPRGSAYHFFRNDALSADPGLRRDAADPDPFYQRGQYGVSFGGPIRRNRIFYFGNWERSDQRAAASTTILAPDFAQLSRNTASRAVQTLASVRIDASLAPSHTFIARHSYDGSRGFAPVAVGGTGMTVGYPSTWRRTDARGHQSLLGLTSVVGASVVNDLRVSYFSLDSRFGAGDERDCGACVGIGGPMTTISQTGVVIGNSNASDSRGRRFQVSDVLAWQTRSHRMRVGLDWEYHRDRNYVWNNEPASITLFSPGRVRAYNANATSEEPIPLPAEFRTLDDILQLPLQNITVAVGEPGAVQEGGGVVRRWHTLWLFAEDSWRVRDRITLTLGLGWGFDSNLNHDLRKPELLEPLLGRDGLGPTRRVWTNVSPVAGVAWSISSDGRTVLRAAGGRYYRPHGLTSSMDTERGLLGAPGLGRQQFAGDSIPNPVAGVPGVPLGTPLAFGTPSRLTGADLLASLPMLRARLADSLASADPAVQQIEVSKQATTPAMIFPVHVRTPSALHANLGLQRELGWGVLVSADVAYRRFVDVPQNGGVLDLNHFNSVRGPVIPRCADPQNNDPVARCSQGPINVYVAPYHYTNRRLLLRADKRLSNGAQLFASYSYARDSAILTGSGFNLDNWLANRGPAGIAHTLNVAGSLGLPFEMTLGFNARYTSAPPFSAVVGGADFNGDGTDTDLLPGTRANGFNRGMGRADLERLVAQFNDTYAGTRDAKGSVLPTLTLPRGFSTGDDVHTLDLRLGRSFAAGRARISLIAEVFNVFNVANLSGHSEDLAAPGFGLPTSRVTQVFGSAGPRALQLAARVSY